VQKTRQSAIGKDRGRVWQRQGEVFAEVVMYLLVRVLRKIQNFENFRKFKKRWKLSEKRTKPKKFENFEKNLNEEFSKNFWFCALFGQFPAFFEFSKMLKKFLPNFTPP
jgi:hypothetical protein